MSVGLAEEKTPRHPGRRLDDPKGLLYRAAARRLLVIVTGSSTFLSGFFIWWLSGQYNEKQQAINDIELAKAQYSQLKKEIEDVKIEVHTNRTTAESRAERIENKVDAVLMNLDGLAQRLAGRREQVGRVPPDSGSAIFCRGGWNVWVPKDGVDDFQRQYPKAKQGECR
jgi:cell division protein FtsB